MRVLPRRLLLIWVAVASVLAFLIGTVAVHIGLDINKDGELCEPVTAGASGLVSFSGIPCSPNLVAILAHFGKYFFLVYAPLIAPTVLYVLVVGIGTALRRARGAILGSNQMPSY